MSERERFHYDNVPDARLLRRRMTESEGVLWERLRGRRFRGLKFRRQHPVGALVLDFYCEELSLAVEVDGAVHASREQRERDRTREEALEALGIRIWRVPAERVERDVDGVLEELSVIIDGP